MNTFQKKSKLTAIPDQQTSHNPTQVKDESINRIPSNKTASVTSTAAATTTTTTTTTTITVNSAQSQEEKRQAVRKLIESIPTKKEDLFTFPLDWSLLDAVRISNIQLLFILLLFFFFSF